MIHLSSMRSGQELPGLGLPLSHLLLPKQTKRGSDEQNIIEAILAPQSKCPPSTLTSGQASRQVKMTSALSSARHAESWPFSPDRRRFTAPPTPPALSSASDTPVQWAPSPTSPGRGRAPSGPVFGGRQTPIATRHMVNTLPPRAATSLPRVAGGEQSLFLLLLQRHPTP